MNDTKTCFVVMGFGKRLDYKYGRTLDLNKTYRILIKPAVEQCGLACIRADEIRHSGTIDVPMYEQLLRADLVIADLSTYNSNAFYELGVRHALKPRTTIVISDDHFEPPFDIGHTMIRQYKHLGEGIDAEDAGKFVRELADAIRHVLDHPEPDSPVYTFIHDLQPPQPAAKQRPDVAIRMTNDDSREIPQSGNGPEAESADMLLQQVEEAKDAEDFGKALIFLRTLTELKPKDEFVTQQLALATYKAKQPSELKALERARDILWSLDPENSTNPETLGLWGAVHKRLWEQTDKPENLERAVRAYEKGFHVKNDYYNGINFAYLLNVRASLDDTTREENIADYVSARRVRRKVLEICRKHLDRLDEIRDEKKGLNAEQKEERYWIVATQAEALVGIGAEEATETQEILSALPELATQSWMVSSTLEQLEKLRGLLAQSPL